MGDEPTYPFPEAIREVYVAVRWVPDRGWCGVHKLMFHWTVHVGLTEIAYEDRYCFQTMTQAVWALKHWTGEGDMPGEWHKHPKSGRRRDPKTGEIWNENDREAEARRARR